MNKLIKLSETHYIVVDDSETPPKSYEGFYYVDGKIYHTDKTLLQTGCKKITHSTESIDRLLNTTSHKQMFTIRHKIKPLSLSEVEEAIYGYSINNMAHDSYDDQCCEFINAPDYCDFTHGYSEGFKAHRELVKDKYTFEQVLDAWELGAKEGLPLTKKKKDELIQSLLPKTEWEVKLDKQSKLKLI